MNIIINGKIGFDTESPVFTTSDRAFRYGDGLFETMIFKSGKLRFWDSHYERLTHGMTVLKMDKSNLPDSNLLQNQIMELAEINEWALARVRLVVWRQNGGLYTPLNNHLNYLIEMAGFSPPIPDELWLENKYPGLRTGFAKSITLSYSAISHLKTCNALPYIIASIEKSERNLDDVIILNNEGHIAESTHANIFWFKNGVLFTPAITTGCLAGIMRKHILQNWTAAKYKCIETHQGREEIMNADVVFISNATGIKFILEIEDKPFDKQKTIDFINSQYFSSIEPLL